ncbi:hypothetical protein K466DRAFT_605443 [Polyporus arcularius HHB13444]|uniref:NACHT domain-containing protein n=1 Tax=Polyporus arcularius HHB13444 TaxID=1314778 RepID=A0A5C3NSL1_9APHY|nr:hypothetical protein K466DRAFT_605443 [Polyporus arcularius HHB13444]
MSHSERPEPSSDTSEAVLDLTVESLEAVKDTIVDALSMPGIDVALDAAIAILKKAQDTKSNHDVLPSLPAEISVGSSERAEAKEKAFKSATLAVRVGSLVRELNAIRAEADKLIKRKCFSQFVHSTGYARAIIHMKDMIAVARRNFQLEGGVNIETKLAEALNNIKTVTARQKTEVLDGTVASLEATKDVIIAAAPVPGLSIALNVLIALLKKLQDARSNCDALVALCREAALLENTLEGLAKTIRTGLEQYPVGSPHRVQAQERVSGSGSKLHERVEKLLNDLRMICLEADMLKQRNYLAKFLHSATDAEAIAAMKDQMAAACQRFQMEGNIAIEALAAETLNLTKAAEEERILDSIPRADDAHYLSAANAMKARLEEGTREQILARLEAWEEQQLTDSGAQPVCVLVGEAGTGKSTIASEFARRLQERDRLGASFFFTRGVQELNSPRKVFSTIASQLARSQPALRGLIVDAAREHLKTAPLQQLGREYKDLIERPLNALSSSHPPIFVVVDALDECTEEGPALVPNLLRLLLSAAAEPGWPLRVFLTSRPEPHYIHRVFTTPELNPHISVVSIQEFRSSVTGDIKRLVRARLVEHETSKTWSEEDPSRVARIVEKSEALFIYARTAVDFLLADADDLLSIQERYEILMRVEQVFGLAPLDTLYRAVLENVFPPEVRFPRFQERLKRVLEYLVAVLEPDGISPATLEKLTDMPTAESVPILNKLRSVVLFERDNVDCRFRILHATFREFLVDNSRSGEAFGVSAEQAHGRLADDCMRVMRSLLNEHWLRVAGTHAIILKLLWQGSGLLCPHLPHISYAFTYHDHHLTHGPRVLPATLRQDSWYGRQANPADLLPLLSTFKPHMLHDGFLVTSAGDRADMLRAIISGMQQSLPAGDKFKVALSRIDKCLRSHDYGQAPWDYQVELLELLSCELLSLVLDILAVMNCPPEGNRTARRHWMTTMSEG